MDNGHNSQAGRQADRQTDGALIIHVIILIRHRRITYLSNFENSELMT